MKNIKVEKYFKKNLAEMMIKNISLNFCRKRNVHGNKFEAGRMTPKMGNKNFYKGKGVARRGRITSKGFFSYMMLHFSFIPQN